MIGGAGNIMDLEGDRYSTVVEFFETNNTYGLLEHKGESSYKVESYNIVYYQISLILSIKELRPRSKKEIPIHSR